MCGEPSKTQLCDVSRWIHGEGTSLLCPTHIGLESHVAALGYPMREHIRRLFERGLLADRAWRSLGSAESPYLFRGIVQLMTPQLEVA